MYIKEKIDFYRLTKNKCIFILKFMITNLFLPGVKSNIFAASKMISKQIALYIFLN